MELFLIRHGMTPGNQRGLYVGKMDQPLCEEGVQGAQECAAAETYPAVDTVYVSPMLRARQTAEILFPQAEQVVIPQLSEMDFGEFEGRHYDELKDDPAYVAWIDSECALPCPGGESGSDFEARIQEALADLIVGAFNRGDERVVIVSHGGVGMNIMARWARPRLPHFHWWMRNCGGYRVEFERADWERGSFADWEAIGREPWHNRGFTFFQNTDCEYFPCHETEYPEDFNCLFCFCPLYHRGMDCGGKPALTDRGVKDCSACTANHARNSYGFISKRLMAKGE